MSVFISDIIVLLTPELAVAGFATLLAAVIRGYSGFGANIVLAPIFTFMFGPVDAVAMMGMMGILATVPLTISVAKDTAWREIAPMLIGLLFITPLGVLTLITIDPNLTRRAIGAIVLVMGVIYMVGWQYSGPRGIKTRIAVGAIAGWLGGFVAIGGPVMVLYFLAAPDPPRVQRANNAVSVATIAPFALVVMHMNGAISLDAVYRSLIMLPLFLLGQWAGARLFHIIPEKIFRTFSLMLLVVVGAITLLA